jgi:hypothetical protein
MSRRSDEWARRSEGGDESSPSEPRRHGFGSAILGLGVLCLGAVMLLDNFGIIDGEDLYHYWPAFLILRPFRRGRSAGENVGVFEAMAILGGAHRRLAAADFQGGDATAILGGCDIDLRDCGSEGGPAEIDTFAFWGGIEIRVPEDWDVQVRGLAVLGAYEDKRRAGTGEGRKVLIVRGTAIMAGVEVKN